MIVTRPAAQAATWVERLQARGIDAVAVPLIDIAPPADTTVVDAAWAGLARRRLVFFVSPNAVERFFARRPSGVAWPADVLAGSPGPGTTFALVEQGVPAGCLRAPPDDAPSFDSEALWATLQHLPWQGASVLIVRGDGGREVFAQTLQAAGARVDLLAAYRRLPPVLDASVQVLLSAALARPADHLWLFSSSEAIDHLDRLAPGADHASARALATHPRIAARARQLGFASVTEARPALEAVVACIQSLQP